MTDAPRCEECKWRSIALKYCYAVAYVSVHVDVARADGGDCGPTGKLFEPKEEKDGH